MIYELIKYYTNFVPLYLRRMGYLHEILSIEARYNRNKNNWKNHLENTRNFIIETASKVEQKHTVTVLGSGLLLDIPIKFLSQNFKEVFLIDIIHLQNIKKQYKNFSNIKFVSADVTGIVKPVYDSINSTQTILPNPTPNYNLIKHKSNLIVSANILSQLPLTVKKFLRKKTSISESLLTSFSKQILQAHLTFLSKVSSDICLISEIKRELKNTSNIISKDALFGVKLPKAKIKWDWEIAPLGEYYKNYSVINKVATFTKEDLLRDSF